MSISTFATFSAIMGAVITAYMSSTTEEKFPLIEHLMGWAIFTFMVFTIPIWGLPVVIVKIAHGIKNLFKKDK